MATRKTAKTSETVMIAGGAIAGIAMAAASAAPELSTITNAATGAGIAVATTGLIISMITSLKLSD